MDRGSFLLLLTPSHSLLLYTTQATTITTTPDDLFYSHYQIPPIPYLLPPSPQIPQRQALHSLPPTFPLTLFSENIAELTHLDQKFMICDLGSLLWLIALPEINQKEPVIREYNLFLKQKIGT